MKELARDHGYDVSLAESLTAPLPNSEFSYNKNSKRLARGRLRAVAPLTAPNVATTTIGVGSKEILEEALRETPRESSVAHSNRVIRATFTAQINLSRTPAQRYGTHLLTTDDFIQVSLATVRESTRHCYWPSDVIAKFLAADVIRSSQ